MRLFLPVIIFIFTLTSLWTEDVTSLLEDRRNILKYGIDGEVITLLDDLKKEKNTELLAEVSQQFKTTNNLKLKQSILLYYIEIEKNEIEEQVLYELDEQVDDEQYILALLNYVREFDIKAAAPYLDYYADDPRAIIASAGIKTIGELKLTEKLEFLQDMFEDGDIADSVQSEILLAFGKLKDEESLPLLLDIVQNPDEDRSNRWYACAALGEIGGEKAYEAVKYALNDEDTILRTYAINAIAKFPFPEVEEILIQQGLRDSFWRVRIAAIEQIEEHGYTSAADALQYKAEKDPETKIRERAIKALGVLPGVGNTEYLVNLLLSEKESPSLRVHAANALIRKNPSTVVPDLKKLFESEWDKKNSRIIEYVAKELSITNSVGLEVLFKKLLEHEDITVKVYAIRGIGINGLISFKTDLENMNTENAHPAIKKAIVTALEQLN